MTTLFAQAVDEIFPALDPSIKNEIKEKVTIHMLEILKEELYKDNPYALLIFDNKVKRIEDQEERSKFYGKHLMDKFLMLPQEKQNKINEKLNNELTQVMHILYKEVES